LEVVKTTGDRALDEEINRILARVAASESSIAALRSAAPASAAARPVTSVIPAAASALLPFVGDSGSGGAQGQVPAPAAGDAAANKFLSADGGWEAVSSGIPAAVWGSFFDLPVTAGNTALTMQLQTNNLNSYQPSPANGDTRSTVIYLPAGTYTWKRMSWKQSNMGILACSLDSVTVASIDNYSAGTPAWQVDTIGSVTVTAGHHRIDFTIGGKNSSSSSYYCLHSVFWFE
jgi:hypothetical protein